MADTATLQTWLTEAETALHRLSTGTLEMEVSFRGRMVKFNQTDIVRLRAYIADLKRQLGQTGRVAARGVFLGS
ncbi:MAG: gpW family head-tail joining protein [Pseudomonadota bacterium]